MLEAYIAAGFDPAGFMKLTPRLYMVYMQGAQKRLKREQHDRIELAWTIAMLMRAKKIPSIKTLLAEPKPLSGNQALAMIRARTRNLPKRTWQEWLKA